MKEEALGSGRRIGFEKAESSGMCELCRRLGAIWWASGVVSDRRLLLCNDCKEPSALNHVFPRLSNSGMQTNQNSQDNEGSIYLNEAPIAEWEKERMSKAELKSMLLEERELILKTIRELDKVWKANAITIHMKLRWKMGFNRVMYWLSRLKKEGVIYEPSPYVYKISKP